VASSIVMEKLRAGAIVIDVRTPNEFVGGAYPGAKNIPVSELAGRLAEIPKDKPVVLYCASGMRSASAAKLMKAAGYADVVNAGGLSDMPR
jgi:phage shock protein E